MMGGATLYPAVPARGSVARRALLLWLLGLIQAAPDAFLTLGHVDAIAGSSGEPIEAIGLEVLGTRFRIVVDQVDE